jgi:hypothetical protein
LFQPARWKAYLRSIQDASDNKNGKIEPLQWANIYSIFHSQKLWFLRDDPNPHHEAAREHLDRCDALLGECTEMVDALEETLANTPKPSEVLDWGTVF